VAQGDTDRARRDFDRALELRPTLAIASLNRGLLHAQEQRYSEALTDLEQALDHGGDPVQVHYQMALVCQAQGEASAARTHLQQVLRLAPDHAAARQRQEQLLREH
jgi:tetratricopeptide (TPR) repeat protein